ncbi:dephospho-CoA kinase [Parabacteroides chinchillae]|uniref:Dephospho-CoA kinase n=1 Tax=Parabacteroides chinchillae TaxID=871327 RepID=A0A8G2BXI0_9BACT|nr:dephospho-CoA kinase [Parabacteroides chinchillae]SEG05091.1 dephospho-CoA kinase [Parabacteroides chinchillae]
MIRIGITGGIGSGKSVVATILQLTGIPVYIADKESKQLTDSSPVIRKQLIELLGKDIYTEQGLNKKLLASYIFNNPECLKQVNAIIHPEVNSHFQNWVRNQHSNICAIESAILFESGFNKTVDVNLMVYAPIEIRIARVLARDNVSREEIIRRISNQMSDEQKKELSDYVIYNDDIHTLLPQANQFLNYLTSRQPQDNAE